MDIKLTAKLPYRNFFLEPKSPRQKHYEILRARFVEELPVKQISKKFNIKFNSVQTSIRDFKNNFENKHDLAFFISSKTGPKKERKKPEVRDDIILLRARGYANTDIYEALVLAGKTVSISLIDQVLREKGLIGLGKRTKEEQERVKREIETRKIPGLTIPAVAPELPKIANVNELDLSKEFKLYSRVAGIFLFIPFLLSVQLPKMIERAGIPGSKMIPALSYFLSLLALKLLDKERKSHITDWNFDEALGLFAGLNILPKKSATTDYSYRLSEDHHKRLLSEWVKAVFVQLCPEASIFALDFHSIPYRGDDSSLENHWVPMRGKAEKSILTFFAQSIESPMLCYANADILRSEQDEMPLRFVEFWKEVAGVKPNWLYFDSKLTTYEILNKLREDNINFITVRTRGQKIIKDLLERSSSDWKATFIDTPERKHKRLKYIDDEVKLRNYEGLCRQIAVTGLSRAQPTLFITNNKEITGREVIQRYISRNYIENELGININFFHMDCLSSEIRLNVNLDVLLTVMANGCYRWLAKNLKGCEKMEPKQLYRKIIETGGHVINQGNEIIIQLDRRSHMPIVKQALLDKKNPKIPWLNGKKIEI